MTPPDTPRRRRRAATKKKTTPQQAKPAAPATDAVATFYEGIRHGLIEEADVELVSRLAASDLTGADYEDPAAAQSRADLLFAALVMGADEVRQRDRQVAANLFADYVERVYPILRARGLALPAMRRELMRQRLVSYLPPETLADLDEAGTAKDPATPMRGGREPQRPVAATARTPDEPAQDESAPEPGGKVDLIGGPPDDAAAQARDPSGGDDSDAAPADQPGPAPRPAEAEAEREQPPADDEGAAVKSVEELIEECVRAEHLNRRIILIIGLPTTGKSFLVQRLKRSLRRDYTFADYRTLSASGAQGVGRTQDVLLTQFTRIGRWSAKENFDLYDMPGDWFSRLLANDGLNNPDENPFFSLIYTILTFADAIVFLAPAYHVLRPGDFVAHGDDDPDLKLTDREARKEQMDIFVDSLEPITIATLLLRRELRRQMPKRPLFGRARQDARRTAASAAVNKIGSMKFRDIRNEVRTAARLDIPGALLLSRADELARKLKPDERDQFDRDPAQVMLSLGQGREYFSHLSSRFPAFSVDFLTAQENKTFTRTFRPERPHAGVKSFFVDWLLPAITDCRKPGFTRWLDSPGVALWMRRWLDPTFAGAWDRD